MNSLKNNRVIDHLGVKIRINPEIISPRIEKTLTSGRYEHQEARQLQKILEAGERMLEIGGGIGFLSTLVAKSPLVDHVVVYEANPKLIDYIRQTHELNEVTGVEVKNEILSNDLSRSDISFYLRNDFWASSTLKEPWAFKQEIKVKVSSFSKVIEEFCPTLILCDIEGGERNLFHNANLFGVKKVLMEIHQNVIGGRGVKNLFDSMSARGFHYDQRHSAGGIVLFSHTSL